MYIGVCVIECVLLMGCVLLAKFLLLTEYLIHTDCVLHIYCMVSCVATVVKTLLIAEVVNNSKEVHSLFFYKGNRIFIAMKEVK